MEFNLKDILTIFMVLFAVIDIIGNIPIIIEEMINFELEMSVIICRDMDGKISAYDPSENVHKNGILIESKVPANISLSIASDAIIIYMRMRLYVACVQDNRRKLGFVSLTFDRFRKFVSKAPGLAKNNGCCSRNMAQT